jgi:hypothetical protein
MDNPQSEVKLTVCNLFYTAVLIVKVDTQSKYENPKLLMAQHWWQ